MTLQELKDHILELVEAYRRDPDEALLNQIFQAQLEQARLEQATANDH